MSEMQVQDVLAQMRALQSRAGGAPGVSGEAGGEAGEFTRVLQESLQQVNATQQHSGELADRFVSGDEAVTLPQVVVAMQRSSLEFEAVTQVRNRLLAAYQEIMNMQV